MKGVLVLIILLIIVPIINLPCFANDCPKVFIIPADSVTTGYSADTKPHIRFDFDNDGAIESLMFFKDIWDNNCYGFKFVKERDGDIVSEEVFWNGDGEYMGGTSTNIASNIIVRFHDFDEDSIPEIVVELESPKESFVKSFCGCIYKINGTGAILKNLDGLKNWIEPIPGSFGGHYYKAKLSGSIIRCINFREIPLRWIYIDGKVRRIE